MSNPIESVTEWGRRFGQLHRGHVDSEGKE